MLAALLAVAAAAAGADAGSRSTAADAPAASPHYFMSAADVAALRRRVATAAWAKNAFLRTKQVADAALRTSPSPAPADGDYLPTGYGPDGRCPAQPTSGWACVLYKRGLNDGKSVLSLAQVYAVTGDGAYAAKAREFLLAWARAYDPPPPIIGHDSADTLGFMIKGLLAYDLVSDTFSASDRAAFASWAHRLVPIAMARADSNRDKPGIPDQTVRGDTSNWQSFGGNAALDRTMAVLAAAAAGPSTLAGALDWNWSHRTPHGTDNGWPAFIDGLIVDGTGGQTFEGVARNIGYGLIATKGLLLIADVAKHVGYKRNLFLSTTSHGNYLLLPFAYYGPYLDFTRPWPQSDSDYANRFEKAGEYRAAAEIAASNALPKTALGRLLRRVVAYGGVQRGANYDAHIYLYGALTA